PTPSAVVSNSTTKRKSPKPVPRSNASRNSASRTCCPDEPLLCPPRRPAAANRADDRSRRLHRGLLPHPEGLLLRHRDKQPSGLDQHAALDHRPADVGLCRNL